MAAESEAEIQNALSSVRLALAKHEVAAEEFERTVNHAMAYWFLQKRYWVLQHRIGVDMWKWIKMRLRQYKMMPSVNALTPLLSAIAIEQNRWYRDSHRNVIDAEPQ